MRKLMLLAAMLALALVAAAPAMAQVSQGFSEEDVESGDVEPAFEVANKGNNANICPTGHQSAQSGNVQNEQGVSQYQVPEADDIGFGGSNITIASESAGECVQTIEQAAAAAAPKGEAKAEAPKAEAKAGKAEAKAEAGKAEAKAGKAEAKAKELPKTGGVAGAASLVGLGAGALLVAGGLIARRIIR